MGVLPLEFEAGQNAASLGLDGREVYAITGLDAGRARDVAVVAQRDDGTTISFHARVRIDTPKEREYFAHGGILHYVLRQLAAAGAAA
jgi:aconitate hydratase